MRQPKQAVILAGGRGERLKPLTNILPKPMVSVNNKPFLAYLIDLLKFNGIKEILLLLGYLPQPIINYFGDGSKFGVNIKYSVGGITWRTGKRIRKVSNLLDQHFLLLYCDNYWPLNLKKLINFYKKYPALVSVTVYSNRDRITKNNILVDNRGCVIKYDHSRMDKNLNGVEIGFFIINKAVLNLMPNNNFNFEQEILTQLVKKGQLQAYLTDHRYYSIGTLNRLIMTRKFLKPKKIILLDRDGVINKRMPKGDYVKNWDEFQFLPGAIKAVSLLSSNGYKIYIISNQAGVARKLMTKKDLETIHRRMIRELAKKGGRINGIYYCPHGRDDGCECRKPRSGLLFQAANEHYFDLTKSVFLGDDKRDIEAGQAAGCRTIVINKYRNLLRVVKMLLKEQKKHESN
jgi:D-glycero-D-manno-heptose 1,7-bisphosphate phosphatase